MITTKELKRALEAPLEESIQAQWRLHIKAASPDAVGLEYRTMPKNRTDLAAFYTSIWNEYRESENKQGYIEARTALLNRIGGKMSYGKI